MAGTDRRFNATRFREAIKFAMAMGAPEATDERVTFKWTTDSTYSEQDTGGNPFSWEAAPVTTDAPADVQVDCAVSWATARAGSRTAPAGTAVGQFDTTHGVLTLLDVDYAQIFSNGRRADRVEIDGDLYDIKFVAAPYGLLEVTVYDVHIAAIDEH